MSDVIVLDNFLPESEFLKINKKFCDMDHYDPEKLPWFPGLTLKESDKLSHSICDRKDNIHFVHQFIPDLPLIEKSHSLFLPLLEPLIEKINIKSCVRIKANLTIRTSEIVKHGFHVDDIDAEFFKDYKVSIFYVNSNDGYTEFEDGSRVESIANRLVTFPAYLPHTGTTCTDEPFRVVINFNYF